jgi:uncharacterized membrane protein
VLLPIGVCAVVLAVVVAFSAQGAGMQAGWTALNARLDEHGAGIFGLSLGLQTSATLLLLALKSSVRLRTRMARYSVRASAVLQWVGATLFVATLWLTSRGVVVSRTAEKTGFAVIIAAALATMLWNQRRSAEFVPPSVELGADDRWRWGLFYADRNDPALFVQSRCGAGYSLNYGRALAWPIAACLAAYFLAMLFLVPHHG